MRLVLTAFTTDSLCLGGGGRVSLGRETRVSHLVSVKPWRECRSFSKGQVQSLYPAGALDNFFLAYGNVMGSGNILLKETVCLGC